MVENARRQGVRMEIQVAADAACESVFAGYDRNMLEEFEVFFFDGSNGSGEFSESDILSQINSNVDENLHPEDDFYGSYADFHKIYVDNAKLTSIALATDDGGMVFRQEAIMFMKNRYGIAFAEELLGESKILEKNIEQGNEYKRNEEENNQVLQSLQEQKEEIDKENIDAARTAAQNENPAAIIEVQKSMGILELVKPDGFKASAKQLNLAALPEGRQLNKGNGLNEYSGDLLSNVLFVEYLLRQFTDVTDTALHDENHINYQIEYLLGGKEHDIDNLKQIVEKLLLIREGANFAYILTDSVKVAEAEGAATLLVGYTGLVPLIEATKYAILAAWAFAESTFDVKRLLSGKKVALIKSSENWQMSLSNIGNTGTELKDDANGITYSHYIRLLMLLENQNVLAKRTINLVEMKLKSKENYEGFKLDWLVSQFSTEMVMCSESVFYTLPFMRKTYGNKNNEYIVRRDFSYHMWQ